MTRIRIRPKHIQHGIATERFGGGEVRDYWDFEEYTEDEPGTYDGGYFFNQKLIRVGGLINADDPGFWQTHCENFPVYNRRTFPIIDLPSGKPPEAALATALLVKTNPSRPKISVPTSVVEFMREGVPNLYFKGKNLIQAFGSAYLAGAFGAAPLMRDVSTMLNFAESLNKRLLTLNNLKLNGKLSYTIDLWGDSKSAVYKGYPMNTSFGRVYSTVNETSTSLIRGHVKWFPTDKFPTLDEDIRALAFDTAYGLRPSLSTVWNLLPWTWLIDWFSNVGDVLSAMDNACNLSHSIPQIMDHSKRESVETVDWMDLIIRDYTPLYCSLESKSRVSVSGSLSASIPILSSGQWSILGALTAAKAGK